LELVQSDKIYMIK